MTELESLKKLRSSAKGSMTKLLNYVSELNSDNIIDIEQLKTRAKRAQEIFETFMKLEEQIIRCNPDEQSDLGPFEDNYYTVLSGLNAWIRKKSISEGISHHTSTYHDTTNLSHNHGADVRLPKINIPIFNGEYKEWQTFFDLFTSTIHEKEYLTSAQKFQYLKSFLRGDAERFLRNTNVTEANYNEALQKLIKRYDKKRHTITSHIEAFLKQPSISNPTAANIRSLLDISDEALRGLKCLGTKAEQRDPWLIYILLNKLDLETQALWSQQSIENKDFPELTEFFEFLENRTDALESLKAYTNTSKKSSPNPSAKISTSKSSAFATTTSSNTTTLSCPLCKCNDHKLFECESFKAMPVAKRRDIIKEERRCFNCLNFNHSVYGCKSRIRCRHCQRKHHTMLHIEEEANASPPSQGTTADPTPTISSRNYQVTTTSQVVLPTAMVKLRCSDGEEIYCRALLDSSSQESFITEDCAQKLGLRRTNGRILMKGLGDAKLGHSRGKVQISVRPVDKQYPQWEVEAYVVPKIASFIPAADFNPFECEQLKELTLADPKFNRRGAIEVLLGTEIYYGITGGKRLHLNNHLVAEETSLGWVLAGRFVAQQKDTTACFSLLLDVDASLRAFWEVEAVPIKSQLSDEEQKCEELFSATTTRSPEGKFIVKLPFSESPTGISSTFQVAVSRLRAMERRFERDSTFRSMYVSFMKEYEELGHMEEIANDQLSQQQYYLPHHGVLKTSSSTTKLRVVFDASAKSDIGKSLNSLLRVGPVIQSSLMEIVLRFRQHQFVLTGDVEKMYRQVLVDSEDAKVQNIVWRSSKEQPIRHYRLKTLTYGTASASFLSTRCLMELASSHQTQHEAAATAIANDIYVDDLMTGADSKQELLQLQISINKILQSAKFNMRKWSSNDKEVRQKICDIDEATSNLTIAEHPEATKLLGLEWSPKTDKFHFSTNFGNRTMHTKRPRVGGRLRNSAAPYVTKHPIILSHKSIITKAIVRDYHNRFYHAGINLTSNILRSKYWVIKAKDVVREIVHKCVQCVKQKPVLESQIMGDLPAERVTYADAFVNVGVDYAGPFKVTPVRRRGQITVKAYICIFVCLSTKAVHIEIVCDLTSQSFLAALSRMTARRGLCRAMFSDNGSNFVGANKSLKELYTFLKLNEFNISSSLLRQEIVWNFNPPGAPHMNGLWEAAVKSAKTHLKRVVGDSILSLEEFGTLMTGIESILNSRPLCATDSPSADIDDLILTPAHFIIGRALHVLPEDNLVNIKLSTNARWELVKKLKQHIWVRWHRDYLSSLQRRSKWFSKRDNIKLNDIVIIKDENLPVTRWTIGRIVELHPGNDDVVRVATIKTAGGIYKRPIHKLCILPVN